MLSCRQMTYASGVTYWEQFLPGLTIVFLAIAVLPWLSRDNSWIRTGVIALCLFVSWRYLLWRIGFTLPPLGLTLDYAAGLIFVVVETLAMIGGTLSLLFLTRTINRTPEVERNLPWVRGLPRPPLVDVLICTYNEDESILERTVIGALALDYPNFRLWVCDDGRRAWLEKLCEQHGCGYITRPDNAHAKAGNINNALAHLASLPERPLLYLDPRCRLRAEVDFPEAHHVADAGRERGHRADAAALLQSRPHPDQSVHDARLAGRAALFLRRRDAG